MSKLCIITIFGLFAQFTGPPTDTDIDDGTTIIPTDNTKI